MDNYIDKTSSHYKGEFGSIYEVNQKFPSGGVEGDYVAIDGWAHYWNADRSTWCVNAQRDSYWDELITNIIEHFKTIKGATYMGVATIDTVPDSSVAKMFYFALQGGKYANFGNQDVVQGINVLLTIDGKSWSVQSLISVAQELGASTTMLVSQKAITDAINRKANTTDVDEALAKKADKAAMDVELGKKADKETVDTKFTKEKERVDAELGKKADKETVDTKFTEEKERVDAELGKKADKERVDAELGKKFDKESVAQESGEAEDKVMSQKAVSDKLCGLSDRIGNKGFNRCDNKFELGDIGLQTGNKNPSSNTLMSTFGVSCIGGASYIIKMPKSTNSPIVYFYNDTDYLSYKNIPYGSIFETPEKCTSFKIVLPTSYGIEYHNDVFIYEVDSIGTIVDTINKERKDVDEKFNKNNVTCVVEKTSADIPVSLGIVTKKGGEVIGISVEQEEYMRNDFGKKIISETSITGGISIGTLSLGKKYYVEFNIDEDSHGEIELRDGSLSINSVIQTIEGTKKYRAGKHIIPFVFNDLQGQYLRFQSDNALWTLPHDISLYESASDSNNEVNTLYNEYLKLDRKCLYQNDDLYFIFNALTLGNKYSVFIKAKENVLINSIRIGTAKIASAMVDSLAENLSLREGQIWSSELYTVENEGIKCLRVENASKIEYVKIYRFGLFSDRIKDVHSIDSYSVSLKINSTIKELRMLKNCIDDSMNLLLQTHGEGIEKRISLETKAKKRTLIRVGLHYGSNPYSQKNDEVFFDKKCKADFSDVRFFDKKGNMLKCKLGKLVNMDIIPDDNCNCRVSARGKLINDDNGISYSTDNGNSFTQIPGTTNVSEYGGDVYGSKHMKCVYTDKDDNIFTYAGGCLYKLFADDSYNTIKKVLDFTWENNGTTIYPEIQPHSIDMDNNGVMYLGIYQNAKYFHVDIYKSVDGGESWSLAWYKHEDKNYQHVHHVHSDKFTGKTYFGIDSVPSSGSKILVTLDGISFEELQIEKPIMKDYYPTYFGEGYRLGGGETYIAGNATAYRSEDDKTLLPVIKGMAGVRSYADFGDDSIILCGSSQCNNVAENHIFVSFDKGLSWDSIYTKYQQPEAVSGIGFRNVYNATLLNGDSEPCVVFPADQGNLPSFRLYRGNEHYYREAFIELENTIEGNTDIVIKTGYMMGYPFKSLEGQEHYGLAYHIPLNEGNGKYVHDSLGNIVEIEGTDYAWEIIQEPTRIGDYQGESTMRRFVPSSALLLKKGTVLNFGKVKNLGFKSDFTITFWCSGKSSLNQLLKVIGSFGYNYTIFQRYGSWGFVVSKEPLTENNFDNRDKTSGLGSNMPIYTDDYCFIALTLSSNGTCNLYVNGCNTQDGNVNVNYVPSSYTKLSENDFILGSYDYESLGYISDFKIYNRVIEPDEILDLYRGF